MIIDASGLDFKELNAKIRAAVGVDIDITEGKIDDTDGETPEE